jgi:hypothetical protein
MTPAEFQARYLKSLPEVPPELDLRLHVFAPFPAANVAPLTIPASDKQILVECGLPQDAPPFLSFGQLGTNLLDPADKISGLPNAYNRFRAIGTNSCGDLICLDVEAFGRVVYLNHDRHNEVIYMNSGVSALAVSLCAFQEGMRARDASACQDAIRAADPEALSPGSFWADEIANPENWLD